MPTELTRGEKFIEFIKNTEYAKAFTGLYEGIPCFNEDELFNYTDVKRWWNEISEKTAEDDQRAKADKGKPKLSRVPSQIIWDIAEVREYAHSKYGDGADEWDQVEAQRYIDAMYRHFLAFVENPCGNDRESGLPHLWHLECNAAFLSVLLYDGLQKDAPAERK